MRFGHNDTIGGALSPLVSVRVLLRYAGLIVQLTRREVEAQYRGSLLGIIWLFARPLLVLSVYTFVFGVIWPRDADGLPLGAFAMTMFCGMALYSIFSAAINISCNSVVNRAGFVKQVVFPLEVLPYVQVLTQFIIGLAWLMILYVGVFLVFGRLSVLCLYLPVVLLPLFLIANGIAWLVSSLTVYIRDLKQFVPVVLQVMFFLTPIFWQLDMLKGERAKYIPYLYCNPMTGIVEALRDILIRNKTPDWQLLAILTAVGIVVWYLGFAWFHKTKKGFADVI